MSKTKSSTSKKDQARLTEDQNGTIYGPSSVPLGKAEKSPGKERKAASTANGEIPPIGKGHIRVLRCLSESKTPMTKKNVSEATGLDITWSCYYLGLATPEKRQAAESKNPRLTSLLTRGFVKEKQLDIHGDGSQIEVGYQITPEGRKALKEAEKALAQKEKAAAE